MNAQTQQAGTDYDWTVFSNITQPTNPGAALQAEQPMRRQHWMECVLYSALTLQSGSWMGFPDPPDTNKFNTNKFATNKFNTVTSSIFFWSILNKFNTA